MNVLITLLRLPGVLTGTGTNHEGEDFIGYMELHPLVGNRGIQIHYVATRVDGKHLHREATLLSKNDNNEYCLWPIMEELPNVQAHPLLSDTRTDDGRVVLVFANASRENVAVFREEITLELNPNGPLVYSHSWGLPGGPFQRRSRCELSPSEA